MSLEKRLAHLARRKSGVKTFTADTEGNAKKRVPSGIKYLIAWILYVVIGSYLFIVLERTTSEIVVENPDWMAFKELLQNGGNSSDFEFLREELSRVCPRIGNSTVSQFFEITNKNSPLNSESKNAKEVNEWIHTIETSCGQWLRPMKEVTVDRELSFVDCIYYTMTLVTTIGFGHLSPTTVAGRIFCIPYALVGVPLTCILLAKTSEMLSSRILKVYESLRKRYNKNPKLILGLVTWLILFTGCFMFILLPSFGFMWLENWSMVDACYFSFITISTIGFGDLIAGYNEEQSYPEVYKIGIVVWVMISLGYWIFLLNFLQKAIKSNAKSIKKTFKGKNLTRQAEFMKQLINKMKQNVNNSDETDYDSRLQMMTLIVESLTNPVTKVIPEEIQRKPSCRRVSSKFQNADTGDELDLLTAMVEALSTSASTRRVYDGAGFLSDAHSTCSLQSFRSTLKVDVCKKPSISYSKSVGFDDLMDIRVSVHPEHSEKFNNLLDIVNNEPTSIEYPHRQQNTSSDRDLYLKDIFRIASVIAESESDWNIRNEDVKDSNRYAPESDNIRDGVPLLSDVDECRINVQNNFPLKEEKGQSCYRDPVNCLLVPRLKPYLGSSLSIKINDGSEERDNRSQTNKRFDTEL